MANFWRHRLLLLLPASLSVVTSCTASLSDQTPEIFLFDAAFPPRFTVGGTINGLIGNTPGITLRAGGGTVSIEGDGVLAQSYAFSIPHSFRTDDVYSVQVASFPVSGSSPQLCTVFNKDGKVDNSDIADVLVDCVDGEWITVNTAGLLGDELRIERTEAGGRTDTVSLAGGTATKDFPTPSTLGVNNSFVIVRQPQSPYQDCVLGNPGPAHITTQTVNCTTRNFDLNASIQGLANPGLILSVNGSPVSVPAGTTALTLANLSSGTTYSVSVNTQPTGQNCAVTGSTGTIGNSNRTVTISCSTFGYAVGGDVAGLNGAGLAVTLHDVGGVLIDTTAIANGSSSYFFSSSLTHGGSYTLTIAANPESIWQTCVFGATGTATVTIGPVTGNSISNDIICSANTYAIRINVSGLSLSGNEFTASLNGSQTTVVTANGVHAFATPLSSGTNYSVRISGFKNGYYCQYTSPPSGGVFTGTVTNATVTVPIELEDCYQVHNTYVTLYEPTIAITACNVGGCPTTTGTFAAPPTISASTGSSISVTVKLARRDRGSGIVNVSSILNDDSNPSFFYNGACPNSNDESCLNSGYWAQVVCNNVGEYNNVGDPPNFAEHTYTLTAPDDGGGGPYTIRINSGEFYCSSGTGATVIDLFKANPTSGIVVGYVYTEN